MRRDSLQEGADPAAKAKRQGIVDEIAHRLGQRGAQELPVRACKQGGEQARVEGQRGERAQRQPGMHQVRPGHTEPLNQTGHRPDLEHDLDQIARRQVEAEKGSELRGLGKLARDRAQVEVLRHEQAESHPEDRDDEPLCERRAADVAQRIPEPRDGGFVRLL